MFPLSGFRPATVKRFIKPTLDQVINSNNQKLREGLLDEVVSSKLFTTEYKESYSQLSQGKKLQPECQDLLARTKGAETIAVARKLKKEFDHKINELISYKARLTDGIKAADIDGKVTLTPLAENVKIPSSGITFLPKVATVEYPMCDEFFILLKKPVESIKPSSLEPPSQHSAKGYQFKRLHGQEPIFYSNRDAETRSRGHRLGLQIQNQFGKSHVLAQTMPVEKSLAPAPSVTPVEIDLARKQSKHAKFFEAKFEEGDFPRKKAPAITIGAKELAAEEAKVNKMQTILESPAEGLIDPTSTVASPTSFWADLKTSGKENWQKRKEDCISMLRNGTPIEWIGLKS